MAALWVVALLVVTVVRPVLAVGSHRPAPPPRRAAHHGSGATETASPDPVPLGVYAGPGNLPGAQSFAATVHLPVPYAFDYLSNASWASIADPSWFLQHWEGTSLHMIWGVPMLPGAGGSLAAGAAGAYDGYFTALAVNLVSAGFASSILSVGWDPDQPGSPWSVRTAVQAHQYVTFWRRIVAAMRAVPGAQFVFAWDIGDPARYPPAQLYPGDAVVGIVATDAFDVIGVGSQHGGLGAGDLTPGAARWDLLATAPGGPDFFAAFAAQHHKALMIAKWGLIPVPQGGVGDDPGFVAALLAWCARHQVVAAVTWAYGPWSVTGGGFPASAGKLIDPRGSP